MEAIYAFFEGYTAAELINMLVLAALFIIPNAGVRFLNFLKNKLGLSAEKAQAFFLGTLTLIVIASMWVTGQIGEVNFTLKTFTSIFLSALVPAKFAYKRLVGEKD